MSLYISPKDNMPHSFAPSWNKSARVLILGSMPGEVSLKAQEYYAHPRNGFWAIMGKWCGASRALPYQARLERLQQAGIALWDVLEFCDRAGSLDSAIVPSSVVVNPISGLLEQMPEVQLVATNGGTATRLYQRHRQSSVAHIALPSTSPAFASMSLEQKTAIWCGVLDKVLEPH
jgi:double-stranded uracil-DNA glycosylase